MGGNPSNAVTILPVDRFSDKKQALFYLLPYHKRITLPFPAHFFLNQQVNFFATEIPCRGWIGSLQGFDLRLGVSLLTYPSIPRTLTT